MPPWFVEKEIGIQRFKDDESLSEREIETIARWVDAGAPQGNPADLPPAPARRDAHAWTIGTPDLVVTSPALDIKPVAADFMKDVGPVPTGLQEDRYIRSIEVREVTRGKGGAPGQKNLNYFLVHHATITVADPGAFLQGHVARIEVRKGQSRLAAFDAEGRMIANYPVTIGSTSNPSPLSATPTARLSGYRSPPPTTDSSEKYSGVRYAIRFTRSSVTRRPRTPEAIPGD